MEVRAFFEPRTSTLTYVVWDPETRDAVVIDPVLDYDPAAVKIETVSAEQVLSFVEEQGLKVHYLIETHVHADHLTGALALKEKLGARTVIGEHITEVQSTFAPMFGWNGTFRADGSQWDVLARDGQPLQAGSLTLIPIHTPGHTPACVTWRVGDALFTGDTLFMPDFGTGRCDFPGGSAEALYDSITRLYALPDDTRVFVGHDYQPGGRELVYETTIGACKAQNKQLRGDTARDEFVTWRKERDATLKPPALLFQSLQVNAKGGELPEPDKNGVRYMRLPMNQL
ncbi:MAG: MBL fold metallo-hydrolase [Alphaproteobacteria bacterium]|nr:MBL fold metallo-hydrolase [Alphaproteobacteria bacterium]MCB9697929.1 MBL fold metallo-hydrolase [Alphaproteobacteria bacterium]